MSDKKVYSAAEENKPVFYRHELIAVVSASVILSIIFALLSLIYRGPSDIREIGTFKADLAFIPYYLVFSLADGLIVAGLSFFGRLLPGEKAQLKAIKDWLVFAFLFLLGIAAYAVIVIAFGVFGAPYFLEVGIANLIYSFYIYLIAKMYFYGYIKDKRIFYEVVRFALVGAIASIFDLTTCYLFQFVFLPQDWPALALTVVSVTAGFIVGVTVNYLCSVFIVFKATTEKDVSRTFWGQVLFVFLAAVGLFMGYGLQYLFYNLLGVGYISTFIIRTLIVLFWNYFSRKHLIFR